MFLLIMTFLARNVILTSLYKASTDCPYIWGFATNWVKHLYLFGLLSSCVQSFVAFALPCNSLSSVICPFSLTEVLKLISY